MSCRVMAKMKGKWGASYKADTPEGGGVGH